MVLLPLTAAEVTRLHRCSVGHEGVSPSSTASASMRLTTGRARPAGMERHIARRDRLGSPGTAWTRLGHGSGTPGRQADWTRPGGRSYAATVAGPPVEMSISRQAPSNLA